MDCTLSEQKTDMKILGAALKEANCGGYGFGESGENGTLFYTKRPPDSDHAVLRRGVVLPFSSEILKSICELHETGSGARALWTCKKKSAGRLYAQCARGGKPRKCRGEGKRSRISVKVGCLATVTAVPLTNQISDVHLQHILDEMKDSQVGVGGNERHNLCIIQSVNTSHTGHLPEARNSGKNLFCRDAQRLLVIQKLKQLCSLSSE